MTGEFFKIRGGQPLAGVVTVAGSKNAALPFIAAAILTDEEMVLENVPDISDVSVMVQLVASLGAKTQWDRAAQRLSIMAADLRSHELNAELSGKLRGSFLLSGALLSRVRKAALPYPGGDAIGARPLLTHLAALRKLGVHVLENGAIFLDGKAMKAGVVILEESSVTATENTMLAAVLLPGTTEIHLAVCEPHVQELMRLLNTMGGRVRWKGIGVIEVEGVAKLHGATYSVNPDEIEVSSFAALAAATHSELVIRNVEPKYLDATLLQLEKMGVEYRMAGTDLLVGKPKHPYKGFRIQSGLFPKLLSDQVPPFSVLATQAAGETLIQEWMYESRLKYLDELSKMGANATILDPHRAIIVGPTPLYGKTISSLDVRSGMTLVIAALVATGETILTDVYHIDRGYERVDERLKALGADIQRLNQEL